MSIETPPPSMLAKRFGYELKRAQHALRVAMDSALRPLALTTPQYAVLSALEAESGMSNARLARISFVTPQTMHGLLTILARSGLIARDADAGHGRILHTCLSSRGSRLLAEAHLKVAVIEAEIIASLGKAESVRMTAALTRCADSLPATRAASA